MSNSSRIEAATRKHVGATLTNEQIVELVKVSEATGAHTDSSLAEFELLTTLRVVDLTRIPNVPSIFEDGPRESLRFLRHFAKDVSQPFTPDKELHIEYAPSQVFSEY